MAACACGCGQEVGDGRTWMRGHSRRGVDGFGRSLKKHSPADAVSLEVGRRVHAIRVAHLGVDTKMADRAVFAPSGRVAGMPTSWDDPYARIGEVFVEELPSMVDPTDRLVYAHRCDHSPSGVAVGLELLTRLDRVEPSETDLEWARMRLRRLVDERVRRELAS